MTDKEIKKIIETELRNRLNSTKKDVTQHIDRQFKDKVEKKDEKTNKDAWYKAEYEKTIDLWKVFMEIRRKDLVYITTIEVAIFYSMRNEILSLYGVNILLAIFGLLFAFIGMNNERRLAVYNVATRDVLKEIELKYDVNLYSKFREELTNKEIGLFKIESRESKQNGDNKNVNEPKGLIDRFFKFINRQYKLNLLNRNFRTGRMIMKNQTTFFLYYLIIIITWMIVLWKNKSSILTEFLKLV